MEIYEYSTLLLYEPLLTRIPNIHHFANSNENNSFPHGCETDNKWNNFMCWMVGEFSGITVL